MSSLKITITLEDEPKTIVDEFLIEEWEIDAEIDDWKMEAINKLSSAIAWERLTRKKKL